MLNKLQAVASRYEELCAKSEQPDFYADPKKAAEGLGWTAKKNLADMCRDAWNWQQKNPGGYAE